MRRHSVLPLLAALVLLVPGTAPLFAHHSVAGQFDTAKTLHLTGVISRVDWINPHTQLYLDVRDAKGVQVTWKIESLPVAMMRKAGLNKDALAADGQKLNVDVHPARDGTQHLGYLLKMTFSDGHSIQFAPDPNAKG